MRALDTSNAWSSDDSDEETHFREMVQLSIQARQLEPKGTGDDAVDEDDSNVHAARDTVLDSSDDDADDADDADARGDAASESPALRCDGDVSVDSPQVAKPSTSHLDGRGPTRSLTEVLASMSAAPVMEPAAPELVAALAALGIDVADGGKLRTAPAPVGASRGPSPFGALPRSRPAVSKTRGASADFALPVRTGGGYDVRARASSESGIGAGARRGVSRPNPAEERKGDARWKTRGIPPAARRATPRAYRNVAGTSRADASAALLQRVAKQHQRRFVIHKQEVVCFGRLTDAEHFGCWAHAWWSDDDADRVASAMSSADRAASVAPTPFPVGFTTRTTLRLENRGENHSASDARRVNTQRRGKENAVAFGGRVAARGADQADADAFERVVECRVRERRAGRPWEGPEFTIRLVPLTRDEKRKRPSTKRSTKTKTVGGATPRAAAAAFAESTDFFSPGPRRRARLPAADALFGFSSRAVLDALAARVAAAGRAVTRLRAPHGVGLATLRVDALDREFDPDSSNRLEKTNEKTFVAEWRSSRGAFPLLPGYRVTFALCAGTAAACEVVRSNETPGGVAFAVTVRDGGAVAKRVRSRCPDRAWAKLEAERRVLIFSGALDARLALDRTEAFLGAHLFGFESPTVARMTAQSEAAAAAGDAFLLAEPFLRDVYGARASGKEKESQRKRVTAEYL